MMHLKWHSKSTLAIAHDDDDVEQITPVAIPFENDETMEIIVDNVTRLEEGDGKEATA